MKPSKALLSALITLNAVACDPSEETQTAETHVCHPIKAITDIRNFALSTLTTVGGILNNPNTYSAGTSTVKNSDEPTIVAASCNSTEDFQKNTHFAYCNTSPDWNSFTNFTIDEVLYQKWEDGHRSLEISKEINNYSTATVSYPKYLTVTTENGTCKIEYLKGTSPEPTLCSTEEPRFEECEELLNTVEKIIKQNSQKVDEINKSK